MTSPSSWKVSLALAIGLAAGCSNEAIQQNKRQLEQNRGLIEENQKEIEALQQQRASTPAPQGEGTGCDEKLEALASAKAKQADSLGNLGEALGYYEAAASACPSSSKAAVNLAKFYETLRNREAAIQHYRIAANSTDSDSESVMAARRALSRLEAK